MTHLQKITVNTPRYASENTDPNLQDFLQIMQMVTTLLGKKTGAVI